MQMASPETDMLFPDALKLNASLTTPLFPLQHYFVELCCTIESICRFSVYIEITANYLMLVVSFTTMEILQQINLRASSNLRLAK